MRAQDIIRAVLDILDQTEEHEHDHDDEGCDCGGTCDSCGNEEEDSRFRQIYAILDADRSGPLANTPTEVVAPVSAVTTDAGGGLNGPKHVDDIRVKDPRGFE